MPILEIEGHGNIEVDDKFLSLSSDEQGRTVEEIISSLGGPKKQKTGKERFFNPQPDNPIGPPLAPSETPQVTTQKEKAEEGTVASRIFDAAARGASKAANLKDPLGLNPETVAALQNRGVFPNKDTSLLNPIPYVNEAVGAPLLKAGDVLLRGLSVPFFSGAKVAGQAAQELGASQGYGKRLERDLIGMMDAAAMSPGRVAAAPVSKNTLAADRGRSLGIKPQKRSSALKNRRINERIKDVQAFEESKVRPVPAALNDAPLASVVKQTGEVPFVGGPIKNNVVESVTDTRAAVNRIADKIGNAKSSEEIGDSVQKGLNRFRFSKPTETIGKHIEELSDKEIFDLARRPSRETSFATRQEALYAMATRKIPPMFKKNGDRNPSLVKTRHSGVVANGLLKEEKASRVSAGVLEGRFGKLVGDLINAKSGFTIEGMTASRTAIGRALAGFKAEDTGLDRTQLKQLYGALSRDIEDAYIEVAKRAQKATKFPKSDPRYVTPENAKKALEAFSDYKRATRFTRAGMVRMDRFLHVSGAPNPEAAARKITTWANKKTSNIRGIRAAMGALKREEANDVISFMLRDLGTPLPSAKGVAKEAGFSVNTFTTNWAKLDPQAKELMFKHVGPDLTKSLNSFVRVAERLSEFESLANSSRTFTNALNIAAVGGGAVSFLLSFKTALATAGGTYAFSRFMSSPHYVRWLTRGMKLQNDVRRGIVSKSKGKAMWQSHVNRLKAAAVNDREMGKVILSVAEGSPNRDFDTDVEEREEKGSFKFPDIMGVSVANADDGVKKEDPLKGTDYLENLVLRQGAGQGLIFGLGDELEALVKAGKTSGPEYDSALKRAREINDAFFKENPLSSIGAQVAGGLLPFSKFQAARAGISAIQDANLVKLGAYGAAHGFGRGEGKQDRLASAGTSAALAAAGGTALPYMFHAPGMAARALKSLGGRAKTSQAQSAAPRPTPSVKPLAPPSNNLPRGNFSGSQPAPGVKPTLPPQGSTPSRFAQRVARARSASESKSLSNVSQARSKIRENIEEMMQLRKVRVGTGKLPNQAPYAFKRQWHPEVKKEVLSTNRDVLKASFSEVKKYYPGITKELFKRKSYETRARIIQGVFWKASKTKIPTKTIVKWLRQAAKNSQ